MSQKENAFSEKGRMILGVGMAADGCTSRSDPDFVAQLTTFLEYRSRITPK